MINEVAAAPQSARNITLVLICLATYFIYALGVLTLQQDRTAGWHVDSEESISIALSHFVYGTPVGAFDSNVREAFWHPGEAKVQDLVAKVVAGSIPKGNVEMYSWAGGGLGSILLATFAMWLFGTKILSLVLFYLAVVGVSVFAFLWRYRDERAFVVPLYFLAVTVMLLTPLVTSQIAGDQMPIGGNRYFSLAAFLPAFHIFYELIDDSDSWRRYAVADSLALLVQAIVLFGALFARNSAGYLLVILAFAWIWQARRKGRKQWPLLAGKGTIVGAAFALWALFVVVETPAYVHAGRVFSTVWHRVFVSLAFHPDWPYGNLREVYDCTKYIPEGLAYGGADRNGHCVWVAYPPNRDRSTGDIAFNLYGPEYAKALRKAYFYVLTHYPRQVFETYFFVKSGLIKNTLIDAWDSLLHLKQGASTMSLFIGALAQIVLFLSFVVSCAAAGLLAVNWRMLSFPLLFVVSLLPLYAAWAAPWTVVDTVFLMYACLALTAGLAVQSLTKFSRGDWRKVSAPERIPSSAQPIGQETQPPANEIGRPKTF